MQPAASRISISNSTGTSARSAYWAKVNAERREALEGGRVEALHHADAAHVSRRAPIIRTRRDDSQGNDPAQLVDADTTASGRFPELEARHRDCTGSPWPPVRGR